MFKRGDKSLTALRIGRKFTLEHFREVHKERIDIQKNKIIIDKRTKGYKHLLENEKQNILERRLIFAELKNQGVPFQVLEEIALNPFNERK